MDARIQSNYRQLVASGARMVLLEYFEAKRLEALNNLVSCTPQTFQQCQGRVLELDNILKDLKQ